MNKLSFFRRAATGTVGIAMVSLVSVVGVDRADAATCNTLNFTTSTQCISPVLGGPGGNVTEDAMNGFDSPNGAFGTTGWMLLDSINSISQPADTSVSQTSEDGFFTFEFDNTGPSMGSWTLNALGWGDGQFAFAIKGATDNAVYLMDKSFISGNWNVNDLDNMPALSNVRLFGTTALAPVPLPAAGLLLVGALGGLGLAARRRRRGI